MVCPVCTVAVGAGVGILRELGVDDIITGMWFGALIVSSIMWFINWLNKKNIHFLFRKILVILSFYALFILPLYPLKILGIVGNTIFGLDKIIFGVIVGTIIFILAVLSNNYLKSLNESKVVINYQKVLVPIVYLSVASIIAYLLLKIAALG